MAIVMAGKVFDKDDVKEAAGNIAAHLVNFAQQGTNFSTQLQTMQDADLITLGLTQSEVDAIKGFFVGDLPTITTALQNSIWIKKLLGIGV